MIRIAVNRFSIGFRPILLRFNDFEPVRGYSSSVFYDVQARFIGNIFGLANHGEGAFGSTAFPASPDGSAWGFFFSRGLTFLLGGAPSFRWSPAARIVLRHLWPDLLLQRFCCRSFCAFESADFAVRSLIFFCCDFTTGFHRFHWIVIRSQRFYSFSLTPETRIPLWITWNNLLDFHFLSRIYWVLKGFLGSSITSKNQHFRRNLVFIVLVNFITFFQFP